MTLKLINWPSFDLHVVLGAPSAELGFVWDDTSISLPSASSSPPPNAQLTLTPGFQPEGPPAGATVSGHGVSVDTKTGVVTVLAPPSAGRRLHNFLLTVSLTDTTTHETTTRVTRIHVHDAVTGAWLTPSRLTVRPTDNDHAYNTFSLLAQFDDGVVGDISNWAGLRWSTDPPSAVLPATSDVQLVDHDPGAVIARTPGAHARVIVEHPKFGHPAEAELTCTGDWASPPELTWIAGRDPSKWREATNILFLPDGFTDGEEELFMTFVRNTVRKLRTPTLRPYDVLHDSLNYWAVFMRSEEPGLSIRCEVYTQEGPGGTVAYRMPLSRPPADAAATWNLAELLYRVGLPVKSDADRDLNGPDGLLATWQRLYGNQVTQARVERYWQSWRLLASRTLVNDRNTAFGATLGSRPTLGHNVDTLDAPWDRARSSDVNTFLANLRFQGDSVGESWKNSPHGKDYGLVCLLVRTPTGRAANRGDTYTSTLIEAAGHYVRPDPGGGVEIVPLRLKRKADTVPQNEKGLPFADVDDPPMGVVATVAHETGHSLGLGDEYGEIDKDLPESQTPNDGNLQTLRSLQDSPSGPIGSKSIRWGAWHRIDAAGVLAEDHDPSGIAQDYRLVLLPGHASLFRKDDLVRLRRRPIVPDTPVSDVMRVKATATADQAHLDLTLFSGSASPGSFKAGSVLLRMVRWPFKGLGPNNLGEELLLMARNIREHIDATQLPLNARPGRALAACELDPAGQQSARNLPNGLPKCRPRNRSRIVGLFEGGSRYHCGVFHPTGVCVMRAESVAEHVPFCPVCRYLMVDRVDPSKHGVIDRDYAKIYPDPRT